MEARKEALRSLQACRFCLRRDSLTSIYAKTRQDSPVSLPLQIMACINIEVYPSDGMPSQICSRCSFFISQGYNFKKLCRTADERLLRYMQSGEAIEPVNWPKKLLETLSRVSGDKPARGSGSKAGKRGKKQPLKVEVSADSEEEEEDEDVFNIKIETDGGDESTQDSASTARIMVTQRGGKLHITEEEEVAQNQHGGEVDDPMVKANASELITGKYPCDDCDKAFPLKQLLNLHKEKHRKRTVSCPMCPEMFFSRPDMNVHLTTHSTDTPFECAECGQTFKRFNLLKKHEKAKHKAKFPCERCNAAFLSKEEHSAHMLMHQNYDKRPFPCPVKDTDCNAKHLRVSHSDINDKSKEEAIINIYQCPECEESFTTQESLAYHEAQHAAQNLTCPLCQEHFADVEAVTEHVKLHADQEKQFGCDFCELVFVSEPKLEDHMCSQHSEEMDAHERLEEEQEEEDENVNSSISSELPDLGFQKELQPKPVNASQDEAGEGEEATYTELATVDTIAHAQHKMALKQQQKPQPSRQKTEPTTPLKQTAGILRKAEEVKRRAEQERSAGKQSPAKQPRLDRSPGQAPKKQPLPDKQAELTLIAKSKVPTSEKQKESKDVKEEERQSSRQENTDCEIKKIEKEENADCKTKKTEKEEHMFEKDVKRAEHAEKKAEREEKTPREDRRVEDKKARQEKKEAEREEKRVEQEEKKTEKKSERQDTPSDKSLRMLERDLQELKRQSSRPSEQSEKTPFRGRGRPPLTPQQKADKQREKNGGKSGRGPSAGSSSVPDSQRRITQWTKERKSREEERKGRDEREDNVAEAEEPTRRSSRSSKVKDYAKMVKDSDDSSSEGEENEPSEVETPRRATPAPSSEKRGRGRRPRGSMAGKNATPKSAGVPPHTPAKRRGRPPALSAGAKKRKADSEEESSEDSPEMKKDAASPRTPVPAEAEAKPVNDVVVTPSGQTLTKVPASVIKSLPPGVKPRLLPADMQKSVARAASGAICEMKLGERTVKVQKIVMTKAEVQDMCKKGLVEYKHGAMVLKAPKLQGVKLPAGDPEALRSLVRAAAGTDNAESQQRQEQETPIAQESPAPESATV